MSVSEIQKMFCPSCGGPIVFEEGSEDTFCPHCGSQLHRDDDNIVRKLEHKETMAKYADRSEERKFKKEEREFIAKQEAKEGRQVIICLIVMAIIALLMWVFIFSLPPL